MGATSERVPVESFARLVHRGSELLRDHEPARARACLERAVSILPTNATARNLLAVSLFQSGELDRAIELYEALEAQFPNSVAAKMNLALARLKLGQPNIAHALLERAVAIEPTHRRAWGYLGVALEQLGRIDEAEQALLAGHYASAARSLRDRHASMISPEVTAQLARNAMPAATYRRKTLPPDPWSSAAASVPALAVPPPDLSPTPVARPTEHPDVVDEIPFETTIAPPSTPSAAPLPNRPVVPLLDAALSSLLVVPHESSVVAHPSGLVLVGLTNGQQSDGGFAVSVDAVVATAGALRCDAMPKRPPPSAQPFNTGFVRVSGTGPLVLRPPPASRLLALQMDADVAFLCDDLVVAFDLTLLCDLGRIHRPSGKVTSLVRFRGDGVIVLRLDHPFLAFDIHGEDAVTLRTDTLMGWIGLLAPEPSTLGGDGVDEFMTFSGEGTVLFHAPHEAIDPHMANQERRRS